MSCDDDGNTAVWDSRNYARAPVHTYHAHDGVQYGCQFSPSSQYNYLTCGGDSLLKVWDLRNCSTPIYTCSDLN
jgi:WD40 repeat protein